MIAGNTISFNMELDPTRWKEDPFGLKIADDINVHLPETIRVFAVVKATKRFSPRQQCSMRYGVLW